MKTVCKLNKCVGCYACRDMCPKEAIYVKDDAESFNAVIDEKSCVDCKICEQVCQINHPLKKVKQVKWLQGWSKNENIRKLSSSGGIAAELSRTIIKEDGLVCSCLFEKGQFVFKLAQNMDQLKEFAGSKYVKSNPQGIYKQINNKLIEGKTILFIGLPCQCAAIKKATEKIKNGKLYTIDLICHGTPSLKLLDAFLKQYKYDLKKINSIKFRDKGKFALQKNEKNIVLPGTMDCYSIAFLNGLIYTENCYECVYADSKRITDLTIGDSWGTELSDAGKGVSLVLCNTEEGKKLVEKSNVYLTDVNIEKAIKSNPQLEAPTIKLKKRTVFFDGYKKGKKFNVLVAKC